MSEQAVLDKPRTSAEQTRCAFCNSAPCTCPSETHVFSVENLDCADCAARIEERIAALPRMDEATLTFTTKQLKVTCPHPEQMLPRLQEIGASVEPDILIIDHVNETPAAARKIAERERSEEGGEGHTDLICIIVGAVLLALGFLTEYLAEPLWMQLPVFVVAYLVAGGEVLVKAAKNIRHGRVFDENFLMAVATIGAFAIQSYPEAVGVMLFYRVGEFFEDRAVDRSRDHIMEAVDMRPETVNRLGSVSLKLDDATTAQGDAPAVTAAEREIDVIPAEEARVGDMVLVRPGDRIPLDGTVVGGTGRVDTSPVTGEPVPVTVAPGSPVTSGCVNVNAALVVQVVKPLAESMVTRILRSVEDAASSKPQIERFITRFARIYTPIVIGIAVLTALIPSLLTGQWYYWVYTALTFLVISCPCAIVLSVPLAFFSGIGAASRLGILFKGGSSIEALRKVKAVVMDKTGTITKGVFAVQSIERGECASMTENELLAYAAAAEASSTHPIAQSVVAAARERGCAPYRAMEAEERSGKGIRALVEANETMHRVLCGNDALLADEGISCTFDDDRIPGAVLHVAIDGILAGTIVIADAPKDDSAAAIRALSALGIRTVMLTGDAEPAAQAIAAQMGIDEVHARLLPDQKLDELRHVRERVGSAMFVGDGINDAPVLAGADVGAAMGSGSDAAIEAADVVFMNSSLSSVPQSIHIARVVSAIALQNIVFALAVKATVMVLGFAGLASMWVAVFADVGVAILCVLNSVRILYRTYR